MAKKNVLIALVFMMFLGGSSVAVTITPYGWLPDSPDNAFEWTNLTFNSYSPVTGTPGDIRDMFGGYFSVYSSGEPTGKSIFEGIGGSADYYVDFTTNSPISITGYNLVLGGDGASIARTTTRFQLYLEDALLSDVTLLDVGDSYWTTYNATRVMLTDTFPIATGSNFRAVFTSNRVDNDGPRVFEFDAVATTVPEPASLILLCTGLGVIGVAAWRRRK